MSTPPIKLKMSTSFGLLEFKLRTQDGRQISTQAFDLCDVEIEVNGLFLAHLLKNLTTEDKHHILAQLASGK